MRLTLAALSLVLLAGCVTTQPKAVGDGPAYPGSIPGCIGGKVSYAAGAVVDGAKSLASIPACLIPPPAPVATPAPILVMAPMPAPKRMQLEK